MAHPSDHLEEVLMDPEEIERLVDEQYDFFLMDDGGGDDDDTDD